MNHVIKKRRAFTEDFKLQVLREWESGKPLANIVREHEIHETVIYKWKRDYAKYSTLKRKKPQKDESNKIAELERLVGRLHIENDILKQAMTVLEKSLHQYRQQKSEEQ
jgi:transposase